MNKFFHVLLAAGVVCTAGFRADATTWFVATNGSDAAAGTDWSTAKLTIQAAIDVSAASDTVLVSNGVYATGGRVVFGAMNNRVAIDRAITVQSVNGPAVTTIKGVGSLGDSAVRCAYVGANAVLSGFTLTNGATRTAGDTFKERAGGGVWCETSAVVSNCVVAGNAAGIGGAGGSYQGTLNNCVLSGNSSTFLGGGASVGTLNYCIISGNATPYQGGGAYSCTLNDCTLSGNVATDIGSASGGGAFACTLNRCRLAGNSAVNGGGSSGGVANNCAYFANGAATNGGGAYFGLLNNCTLASNTAFRGGGAYSTTSRNCIVYFNVAPNGSNYSGTASFLYSCAAPLPGGAGNIAADPLLANVSTGNLHLAATSPCRDVGDNASAPGAADVDGLPRISSGVVDMGAHELQVTYHYVSPGNPSALAPYTNWISAASNIQDAVDAAVAGDAILVSNGVYQTGLRAAGSSSNRVVIDKAVRVMSVNGPGATVIQGQFLIRCVYLADGAVLSGFTLTGGVASEIFNGLGGGARCEAGAALSNCVITGNSAYGSGGGVNGGTLYDCTLTGNHAANSGAGAMSCTLNRCVISGNYADMLGGADTYGGGARFSVLNECTVAGNYASFVGGGARDSTLNNCLVTGNISDYTGGGADLCTLQNCTVTGNHAALGGGGVANSTSKNSILYGNSTDLPDYPEYLQGTFENSCTTPLPAGAGNTAANPLFVAANYFRLMPGSPCLNSGNNAYAPGTTDIEGKLRIAGAAVDMGAYEAQSIDLIVRGLQGIVIVNGDTTPDPQDGTDFGASPDAQVIRNFSIANYGLNPLSISGVTTGGTHAGTFTVLNYPSTVSAGTASNFTLRFHSAVNGLCNGSLAIANNDPVKSSYSFAVQGLGVVNLPGTRYASLNSPTPTPPYTSWPTAAHTIQDAVDWALTSDMVLVNDGTYNQGGRVVSGAMMNRVAIQKPITVQSLNGPNVTVIAGAKDPVATNGDAAVRCAYVGTNATLSGFTLSGGATRGNAGGDTITERSGGGVWCESSALVSNCIIVGNSAYIVGGGTYRGALKNCALLSNTAAYSGGADSSTLIDCTLAGNSADVLGGAASASALSNCTVTGNYSPSGSAGGTYLCTNYNCVLTGNSAPNNGGGAYLSTLFNCTVVSNAGGVGGGVFSSTLYNSIVYGNTAASTSNHSGSTFAYSCTLPAPGGTGNIALPPQFVNQAGGDCRLLATSPCRDTGSNAYAPGAADLAGNPRILDSSVDIGAYEYNQTTAAYDSDADGFTDREEYIADTQPTNFASYFPRIVATNNATGRTTLVINQTSTGRIYNVYSTTNLMTAPQTWTLVPPEQTGTTGAITFTITNDAPQRVYRTGVRLP